MAWIESRNSVSGKLAMVLSGIHEDSQWLLQGITKEIFGPKKISLEKKNITTVKSSYKLRYILVFWVKNEQWFAGFQIWLFVLGE